MPEKRRMYDPEFRDGAVQRAMSQCYGRKPTRLPDHIRTSAESRAVRDVRHREPTPRASAKLSRRSHLLIWSAGYGFCGFS